MRNIKWEKLEAINKYDVNLKRTVLGLYRVTYCSSLLFWKQKSMLVLVTRDNVHFYSTGNYYYYDLAGGVYLKLGAAYSAYLAEEQASVEAQQMRKYLDNYVGCSG